MSARVLRVAAIQMVCINGEREVNLERAGHWVREASRAGAQLVVLPELFSGGYWLNERAWDTAEPRDGQTEAWLRETARRHAIHLGGSYLQARDEDFFNVFALATPAGEIAGRVPKQQPASVEAYLFRGEHSAHVIDTELGRVGVGICYDNAFRFTAQALVEGRADIALMAFSAPTPQRTWYYRRRQVQAFRAAFHHAAQNYARMLGIPAVQANKCGPWQSPLPWPFPAQASRYDGLSEIAESDGRIVAGLADEEGALVGDVTLDPTRKAAALGAQYTRFGRWISPVPLEFRLYRLVEAMGTRAYRRSAARRVKARALSAAEPV